MRPFLALLALPILSAAAELSLDDSLRLALERHPDVLAADAGSRLRLAEALAAEQRAAPRLEAEAKDLETDEAKKQQQQRQTYIKRVIVHPSFYNIGLVFF